MISISIDISNYVTIVIWLTDKGLKPMNGSLAYKSKSVRAPICPEKVFLLSWTLHQHRINSIKSQSESSHILESVPSILLEPYTSSIGLILFFFIH